MKFPDPSCGLYSRHVGAWVFALIHSFSAFYALAKYVDKRVIQTSEDFYETGLENVAIRAFIVLGLIFNFILQIVLIRGVTKKKFSVCRVWLILGISGSAIWIFGVYDMSCGFCPNSLSVTCAVLGIVSTLYQCYVYYVILAFAMTIPPTRSAIAGRSDGDSNSDFNMVPDDNNNYADSSPVYPGIQTSKMENASQCRTGIPKGKPSQRRPANQQSKMENPSKPETAFPFQNFGMQIIQSSDPRSPPVVNFMGAPAQKIGNPYKPIIISPELFTNIDRLVNSLPK